MSGLIILIVFGIGIGLFSTQNTQSASITFANYTFRNIPMYLIILGAILSGIFVSWIISLFGFVSSFFTLHGKESKIKESKKEIANLTKRLHELELENERLKAENNQGNKDNKSL
jgi:putative membrane protein